MDVDASNYSECKVPLLTSTYTSKKCDKIKKREWINQSKPRWIGKRNDVADCGDGLCSPTMDGVGG